MLGFILSLKDEDGNDITSEDADILYNIVCDIISNTDDEIEDVVHMGLVGMPVVVCVMWVAAGFSLSVVVSCRGISFERWNADILLIDSGKKVDYENSHL